MKGIIILLATLASAAEPQLSCSGNDAVINRLVSYCEMRETMLSTGGSLAVRVEGAGSITVVPGEDLTAMVQAQVVTAAETVWQAEALAPAVQLETVNGPLVVRGPKSDEHQAWVVNLLIRVPKDTAVSLRTISGRIDVSDVESDVTVTNVNGNIALTRVAGNLSVHGVNGHIQIGVSRWQAQRIEVATVNGGIEFELPAGTAAHAVLSLTAGTIAVSTPGGNWDLSGVAKKAAFDIGGGGSLLQAALVAGHIRLHQGVQ